MTAVVIAPANHDVSTLEVPRRPDVILVPDGPTASLVEVASVGAVLITEPFSNAVIEVVTPGPQGAQGDIGAQGEVGATGPSPSFDQVFATPLMVWTVIHPLNTHPVVTTVDQNDEEIIGDVMFPDNSTVIITFGLPFAGTARLKA